MTFLGDAHKFASAAGPREIMITIKHIFKERFLRFLKLCCKKKKKRKIQSNCIITVLLFWGVGLFLRGLQVRL